jgi:Histone deacetylase domain
VSAALNFRPQLVLISAGFDAHRLDPTRGCMLENGDLAQMACHVRDLREPRSTGRRGARGGYDRGALADCVIANAQSAPRRRRGRVDRARSDSDASRSLTAWPLMAPLAIRALTVNSDSSSLKLNVLDENPTPRRSGPVSSCTKIDQEQVAAAYTLPALRRQRLAPDRLRSRAHDPRADRARLAGRINPRMPPAPMIDTTS